MTVESFITDLLGPDLPIRIRAYDGSDVGPYDAATTVTLRSHDALIRMVTAPGELGITRAYVAGDIDIDGDIYDVLELRRLLPVVKLTARQVKDLVQLVGVGKVRRILPPPEEHRRNRGRLHTRRRDSDAISHHYDVSNEFYEMVLGPSMTYSCAVFEKPSDTLEQAQANKYELISQKLGLEPGMRLLDIGCGWGGMVLHAAEHHGVEAVGVTISQNQVDLARKRVAEAGLTDRIDIRLQDYRDVKDGPFDAISSIGMFEHVGMDRLGAYFNQVADLLVDGGRVMNHAISRTGTAQRQRLARKGFIDRYVFPDGELHEVGTVVSALQDHGLEVRHVENLREHYALTLRQWVHNLEENWDEAVAETSEGRAKVWRLYMAGSAVMFEDNCIHVDQVLAVKTPDSGRSSVALRPDWNSPGRDTFG
ncbi:MAG: cyclopropane-fatty-acyl-phospholipid synthase family protein [Actinomycetia bacterium]|nr:cyclopropane-fatty-acyl-phospholipid synthase family protein [Actinomycetes bacterium]